ncbi:hypothetical protein SLEP1_g13191 [Rubroshorea leprosula]|uniref:Uncharacterized protein n=1 Tax=Rubroshorea leprosula TaxID=152421 RepID=A0AAV5IF11_9ROSI|nr:hypothetical protein SLEP1_g13191 [Rubroshorea leprosula]
MVKLTLTSKNFLALHGNNRTVFLAAWRERLREKDMICVEAESVISRE